MGRANPSIEGCRPAPAQHNWVGGAVSSTAAKGTRLAHPPDSGRDADGTEVRRRAIVANRQQMLVDVIARLLADEGIEIVGTASAAEETIALAVETRPDLAVIGLTLDRAENVEILSRLRTTNPNLKIVALSSSEDEIRFALAGGAGCLLVRIRRARRHSCRRSAGCSSVDLSRSRCRGGWQPGDCSGP